MQIFSNWNFLPTSVIIPNQQLLIAGGGKVALHKY